MAADEKWYFTKEQLANTPSRKCGYEVDKELSYRQQAANFIQDMGQRLQVTQLCINTAIVYMHRFYVFHSFTHFHRNAMAAAALFLAAKVEEQPRKLEHVIKVAHMCLNRDQPPLDTKSEKYLEQAQDLVFNENVLLQTLGFDVAIDHPHTHVVRCCHLVRASKDLAQTSYFMASNSLHLTMMCLQYKPTVVACFCIHLACKWSNWEIPQSNEGKDWFWYVDRTVTLEQLEQLTAEFLVIFDKCPTKLKRKIMSISATQNPTLPPPMTGSLFDMEPRRIRPPDGSQQMDGPMFHPGAIQSSSSRPPSHHPSESAPKPPPPPPPVPPAPSSGRVDTYRDYKEKKERERLAQQAAAAAGAPRDGHHGAGAPNKLNTVGKHGQVPPHHRDHNKHPPPVRPGSASGSGVTQARDAVRREQSYAREAQKRELADRHNSDEFMFGPPVRHSEPPLWTAPHIASGMNSGPNCSNNSRKDNQPQQQNRLPVSNSDSRVVKEEVPSNPMQKLPASDAGETQRHAYNHRHGMGSDRHRRSEQYPPRPPEVVTERKLVADAVERRPPDSVERKPSMPEVVDRKPNLPDLSDRKLIVTDLIDRKTSAPDIVDRKPNLVEVIDRKPNLADVVDRKPNFAEVVDRKPNLADVVDRKPNLADVVDRKPNLADIVDRKPNLSDHVERKANVTDHVDRKPEVSDRRPHADIYDNRHDSSSRRPDSSKHQSSQPYHQTPIKRESKPEIKKEEVDHNSRGGSVSRSQPPPPHHHRSQGHEKPPRSRSPAVPPRTKSPISLAPQSKRSDSPHGKQKAVPPHLPTRNGTAVEEKQASRRPETPTVKQEEPPEVLSKSTPVSGDSSHSRSKSTRQRTPPSSVSKKTPSTLLPLPEMPGTPVSPFGSPPPPTPTTPGSSSKLRSTNRNRTSSSSSEPELVPLVTKIDEMKGYKNIIRDSKLGIKIPNRVPDIIPPIRDRVKKEESAVSSDNSSNRSSNSNSVTSVAKELKPPDLIRPFSKPEDLGAVEENAVPTEHHHKSEKKKKKKEHKEHKHKDKDKNREERKHRHKHKEKDKDRHKGETTPIKIKIPKDKINNITLEPINNSVGLKLKIHKDKLTETSPQSAPSGGLKLKISKDMIGGFNSSSSSAAPASVETTPARKRDRSSPRTSELTTPPGPPVKTMRLTTSTGEQRRAANSSNNYGKQNGVEHRKGGSHFSAPGNKVVQKLADTHNAYQSKGSQP